MAIITEVPDSPKPPRPPSQKVKKNRAPTSPPPPTPNPISTPTSNTTNPFHFWFYFTILVSVITVFFITLSFLSPQDPKTWFLNLPPNLRQHYSKGRTIKVQIAPNQPQIEIFSIREGPIRSPDHVLFIHGFGCSSYTFSHIVKFLGQKGVHAVAIDLPGFGFSDRFSTVIEENVVNGNGVFGRVWELYSEIKEKGIFYGFDQLVEKGYVNLEERKASVSRREIVKVLELGSEEIGRVLGQVIDAMGLPPVDLVLHDFAFGLSANWIRENSRLVRSVVVLDGLPSGTVLPLGLLQMPVVREVVLGSRFVFERLVGMCCFKLGDKSWIDAHRILLRGRDGRTAAAGLGKGLNSSFDLAEWGSSDVVKDMPIRVIWSAGWSEEWSEEGRRVATALPQATFVTHTGGRWPQEQNAEEVAESVHLFVSSLPKSSKQAEEEPIPQHIHKLLDESQRGDHHHHHDHHGHGGHDHHSHGGHDPHGHAHAGYMDAYGLGHGWAM